MNCHGFCCVSNVQWVLMRTAESKKTVVLWSQHKLLLPPQQPLQPPPAMHASSLVQVMPVLLHKWYNITVTRSQDSHSPLNDIDSHLQHLCIHINNTNLIIFDFSGIGLYMIKVMIKTTLCEINRTVVANWICFCSKYSELTVLILLIIFYYKIITAKFE